MNDKIQVLYVDDEETLLQLGKTYLEQRSGFIVDTAVTVKNALHLLEKRRYDAIVSDYQMPDMDGIAFLKEIQRKHLVIPFILFTGRGREEVVIEAINNGADFYLQKGGDPKAQFAELEHKIRQSVARQRAESSLIESEKRLSDIINFLPDATFAVDRDGIIIAWNRAIEDMTGMSAEQMLGKGNYEYALPFYGERRKILLDLILDSDDQVLRGYSHIIRQKDVLIADTKLTLPHRGKVTLTVKASTLYDSNGEITGAIESIRDITEQKNSEKELRIAYEQIAEREEELRNQLDMLAHSEKKIRESEAKFRSVFEKSQDAFILIENGTLVDSNEKALHLFGCRDITELAEMHIYDSSSELQPDGEDSKTNAEKNIQTAFKKGENQFEWVHKRKDGSIFPAEVLLTSFEINENKYLLSSIRDITERKLAEIAISESEENYRNVIEFSPFGMYFYEFLENGDLIFTGANPAADTMLGIDHSQFIGKTIEEAFPSLVSTEIPENYRRIAKEGGFWHNDRTIYDGTKIQSAYSIQVFQIQPRFIVAAFFDTTGLKLAETALKESEEKYRKLFEESNDAIFFSETTTRKITDCNRKAELLTGYTKEALLSMVADHLHPKDDRSRFNKAYQKFLNGYTDSIELSVLKPDGRTVPVSINASPVQIGGKNLLIGIFRDLSIQKKIERTIHEKTFEIDKFFNMSLDLFCIADTNGYFHRLNPEWENTLGYNLDELEGKQFLDFVHPDDLEKTIEAISILKEQKDIINFVNRYRHKDNTYRWIEWRSASKDEMIFAAARDITHHYIEEHYNAGLNQLKQDLLVMQSLGEKLKKITDCSISLFNADYGGIWITRSATSRSMECLVEQEKSAVGNTGPLCLHLVAGSENKTQPKTGTNTIYNGSLDKIPGVMSFIDRIATGTDPAIIIPDISHAAAPYDLKVKGLPDHSSFAGFQLYSESQPIGVFAIFSTEQITTEKIVFLTNLASTTSQVIQTTTAEDALRESEEKFRELITLAPIPFCLVNSEKHIEYCNNRFVETFGYTKEDIPTLEEWWHLAYPDESYRQKVIDKWNNLVKKSLIPKKDIESSEYHVTCRDGTVRDIIISGITIKNMYLAAFIDITKQRRAEEALRKSKTRYRNIIENIQDVFFKIDKDNLIAMTSASAVHMFGYNSVKEMLGQPVLSMWHNPDDQEYLFRAMEQNRGAIQDFEAELIKKDGTRFWVSISAHMNYDEQGMYSGTEGIIHEISRRKKIEETLLLTNKKLNLLSSITRHDINNQLHILLGYLDISKIFLTDTAKLGEIIDNEEHVANTIARQIGFTKDYENMGIKLPIWQNVAKILDKMIPDLPVRDIRITVEEKNLEIFADPLLEKVFFNLIDNALKYGGKKLTEIRIFSRQKGSDLLLMIQDNGAGVNPVDKSKLFEKGFGKNTGLGLFLSREILGITGITIKENGTAGKGATFEILVPNGGYRFQSS
ncbi:MAG: PAS domain S-box protein [Methanomicrobiales archaeon]|nr:PAS domain S-box protein [Methanomicrobiales archaeon]